MAIVWGSIVTGGTGAMKLGYEVFRNGTKMTVDYYLHTRYSVEDISNNFYTAFDGSERYNGAISIYAPSNSSWSESNILKLATYSTTSVGNIGIYARLSGIDTLGASLTAEISSTETNYTLVSNGSVSITDNGNNTITISGISGSDGYNNYVWKGSLYWKFDNSSWYSEDLVYLESEYYSKTIAIPSGATFANASFYTFGSLNTSNVSSSAYIKYYGFPGAPGKPILHYLRPRGPMLDESLYFSWNAAGPGSNVPIKGYRLRIYKNDNLLAGIDPNNPSATFLDTNSTSTSFAFSTSAFAFAKGDNVQLGIYSYGLDGSGNQLFNGSGAPSSQVWSDKYTFVSSGIIRINVNGTWKEGQVYVKVNGIWKEADSVYVKSNGSWKESI